MKNSENLKYSIIPVTIIMLVYNIWFFVLLGFHTPSQWVVYAFTLLAFILQIGLSIWVKNTNEKEVSLSSTTYICGVIYIAFQIVIGRLLMYIPSVKITCAIELIVCTIFLILLVGMGLSKNVMRQTEERYTNNVVFVREMHIRVMRLKLQVDNSAFVREIERLEEALKYSDPVSNNRLQEVELELENLIRKIEMAVHSNSDEIYELVDKSLKVLEERNNLCKLTK